MCNNENEKLCFNYEKNNQKVLVNGGVCLFFKNVFFSTGEGKLPSIKPKLKKILVDFGMCQTYLEINQKLNFIKVFYKDEQAKELKGLLLQRFNQSKESQPDKGKIRTYTGLTKLLFQEFISASTPISLVDDNPFNEIKEVIRKGNLSPTEPLKSIFRGELG